VAVTSGETYIGNELLGLDIWPHGGDLNQGRDGTGWLHIGASTFGLLDESVQSMAFRDGDLWVATSTGIHRLQSLGVVDRCPSRDRNTPGDPIRQVNASPPTAWAASGWPLTPAFSHHERGDLRRGRGVLHFTMENSPYPTIAWSPPS
jgi:hypothetical protein